MHNGRAPLVAPVHDVLLVEDDVDSRESIRALLESWGYRVAAAGDGLPALELALTSFPSVALIDLTLPVISGYELAIGIRRQLGSRRPYLVAMTGWSGADVQRRIQEAGFDRLLLKPIAPINLSHLLTQHVSANR